MIRVGIGGWNYPPWRGTFYPKGLAQAKELEFASRAVTSIEINATYHRLQKRDSFKKWAGTAPDGFQFSVGQARLSIARARPINGSYDLASVRVGAHDEIFQAGRPVLVGVDTASTFCYLLSPEEQRDGETWGVRLLEPRDRGLAPRAIIGACRTGSRARVTSVMIEAPSTAV